jgi:fatty acyl-CoA reductase
MLTFDLTYRQAVDVGTLIQCKIVYTVSVTCFQLFGKVKAQIDSATLSRKVVGIPGDVTLPDLGLSAANRQLLTDRVSIIFHAAATIRFDEPLKRAVLINTRGTRLMLELAQDMKKLEVWPR